MHCKKSYIECDLLHNTLTISGKKVFIPNAIPLEAELSCFANSIAAGKALQNSAEASKRDLEVLDKISHLVYFHD